MPDFDVPLAAPDIGQAEIDAVTAVLGSSRLSQGTELEGFESDMADYLGVSHCLAVNSGTDGLHLALTALGVKAGDEVITPAYSFVATANAIVHCGARPVFVDIDPVTLNIDVRQAADAITARTRAIVPVHVFGRPADLDGLSRLAGVHGIAVLEDACQALGSRWHGRPVGTFAEAGVFSFYPNKPITTGEGAIVTCRDIHHYQRLRRLRNQGRDPERGWFDCLEPGYSARMTDLQCALGRAQLRRMEDLLAQRKVLAENYMAGLKAVKGIELPAPPGPGEQIAWSLLSIRLPAPCTPRDRDRVITCMADAGVQCGRYFPPLHLQPWYKERFAYCEGDFPYTESVAGRSIALPFFTTMSVAQVEQVCATLAECLSFR